MARAKNYRYDAFISYRHSDAGIVQEVHKGLHSIGRKFGGRSALAIYRDETNLELHPDLWGRVAQAMAESQWLVAVLSPEAAVSPWCQREVRHWVESRGVDNVLLVLVGGDLAWDDIEHRFDPGSSTSAPEILTQPDVYEAEPHFLDLRNLPDTDLGSPRFRDKVAALAAPIHGIPREELEGIDFREQRRVRRLRRVAVGALIGLTLASLVATSLAVTQRQEAKAQELEAQAQRDLAVEQAQRAVAHDLAGRAERLAASDIGTARLYAAQAWMIEDNHQTRAGLFTATTASPQLSRQHRFPSAVSSAVLSQDLSTMVVALEGGEILQRSYFSSEDRTLGHAPGEVSDLNISADGQVVGVQWFDSEYTRGVTLFRNGTEVALPENAKYLTVALDGRTAAYLVDVAPEGYRSQHKEHRFDITFGKHEVHVLTFSSDSSTATDDVVGELEHRPYMMRLSPDGHLVMVHAQEHTTARTLPTLSTHSLEPFTERSYASMGPAPLRRNVGVLSAHGEYYYNGSMVVPGSLDAPESTEYEPATGEIAEGLPGGLGMQPTLAVSPEGNRVVAGLAGEITVIAAGTTDATIQIPGSSQISSVSMPTGNLVVSADQETVSIWDLDADSPVIKESEIEGLEIACGAENCIPKDVHPNQDGSYVVVQGFLDYWLVRSADGRGWPLSNVSSRGGFLAWRNDSTFYVFEDNIVQRMTVDRRDETVVAEVPIDDDESILDAAWLSDDQKILVASSHQLHWIDPDSGQVQSEPSSRAAQDLPTDGTTVITRTTPRGALIGTLMDGAGQPGKSFHGRISSEFVVSPDGLYVLTQPSENVFLVSSSDTGLPLQSFDAIALAGSANTGEFSSDGSRLFLFDNSPETQAVTRMRTIVLDPNLWLESACTSVARGLTVEEWKAVTELEPDHLACT